MRPGGFLELLSHLLPLLERRQIVAPFRRRGGDAVGHDELALGVGVRLGQVDVQAAGQVIAPVFGVFEQDLVTPRPEFFLIGMIGEALVELFHVFVAGASSSQTRRDEAISFSA